LGGARLPGRNVKAGDGEATWNCASRVLLGPDASQRGKAGSKKTIAAKERKDRIEYKVLSMCSLRSFVAGILLNKRS
jgi:hypothetical protein